jgi:hypothetical protein
MLECTYTTTKGNKMNTELIAQYLSTMLADKINSGATMAELLADPATMEMLHTAIHAANGATQAVGQEIIHNLGTQERVRNHVAAQVWSAA